MLELLLQNGFDPNAKDSYGQTALLYAVQYYRKNLSYKYEKGAEMMINAGVNINAKDPYGQTALTIANKFNETKMVHLLKKYNAQ